MSADQRDSPSDRTQKAPLGSRVLHGSIWTTAGFGTSQVIRLASNLVLTRLLFPEAFGLMAIVQAVIIGLGMFSDLGLTTNIVQSRRGDDPDFLDTAWTVQILRGGVLFCIAAAAALPVAGFYEQPQLAQLLPAAALSVFISGFDSISIPLLQRHLAVKPLVVLDLVSQLSGIAVMIVWVLLYPTVWALVAGAVVSSAAKMVGSHLLDRSSHARLAFDNDAVRELLSFGKWVFFSTILAFLVGQSDRLIFGKLVSMHQLGIYSIAVLIAMLPTLLMNRLGNSVVFPAFSRALEGRTAFPAVYARSKRSLIALGGSLVVVLLCSGPPLIETLYDPRYASAGPMLQILAIGAWFAVLEIPPGSAVLAWGKPRWLAIANGCKLVGIVVLMPLGMQIGGFVGAIAGFVAAEVLRYGVVTIAALRNGVRGLGVDIASSIGLAVAAIAGAQVADVLGGDAGSVTRLASSACTALAVWTPIAAILAWRELAPALRSVRDRIFAAGAGSPGR